MVTFFLQFHETFPEKKGSPPNAEVTIQLIFKFGFVGELWFAVGEAISLPQICENKGDNRFLGRRAANSRPYNDSQTDR